MAEAEAEEMETVNVGDGDLYVPEGAIAGAAMDVPQYEQAHASRANASSFVQVPYSTPLGNVSRSNRVVGRREGVKQSWASRKFEDSIDKMMAVFRSTFPHVSAEMVRSFETGLRQTTYITETEGQSAKRIRVENSSPYTRPGEVGDEYRAISSMTAKHDLFPGSMIDPKFFELQMGAFNAALAKQSRNSMQKDTIDKKSSSRKYVKLLGVVPSSGGGPATPYTLSVDGIVIDLMSGVTFGDSINQVEGRTLLPSYISIDMSFYIDAGTPAITGTTFPVYLCQWSMTGIPTNMRSIWNAIGTNMSPIGVFKPQLLPKITILRRAIVQLNESKTRQRVVFKVSEKDVLSPIQVDNTTSNTWSPPISGGIWLGTFRPATSVTVRNIRFLGSSSISFKTDTNNVN